MTNTQIDAHQCVFAYMNVNLILQSHCELLRSPVSLTLGRAYNTVTYC